MTYRFADGTTAEKGYSGDFGEAVFTAIAKKDAGDIASYTVHRASFDDAEVVA